MSNLVPAFTFVLAVSFRSEILLFRYTALNFFRNDLNKLLSFFIDLIFLITHKVEEHEWKNATILLDVLPMHTATCRLERLGIGTNYGHAKIAGTILGLSGAMVLTFYKGVEIDLWATNVNLAELLGSGSRHSFASPHSSESGNRVMGSFLAVASCLCYALWLIIQVILTQRCHFAADLCFVIARLSLFCLRQSWPRYTLATTPTRRWCA